MLRKVLHSKLHHARVTEAREDYIGSITIDANLLDACGMRVNDVVLIANCENGARFETYVFRGAPGSRTIGLNGAAAKLVAPGDRVIIMHWAHMTDAEYADHHPTCLILDEHNDIERTIHYDPDVLIPQPVR